jgi:hypothetical protein
MYNLLYRVNQTNVFDKQKSVTNWMKHKPSLIVLQALIDIE